jgi:hypothetical protein
VGTIYLGNGVGTSGTLYLGGYNLTANTLNFGQNGGAFSVQRAGGGTLSTPYGGTLNQYGGSFSFAAGDSAGLLYTYNNATATIVANANVIQGIVVGAGSTLTLAPSVGDFSAPEGLAVSGILNANGIAINTTDLAFSGPFSFLNPGPIATGLLSVSSPDSSGFATFNLAQGSAVRGGFSLYGVGTTLPAGIRIPEVALYSNNASPPTYATATTSATNNITTTALVSPGCTLNLGADLTLSVGAAAVDLNGTLNANGHAVNAASIAIGYLGGPVSIQNDGLVTTGSWSQSGSSQVQLHQPGDALGTLLLSASSSLAFADAAGQTSGLTVTGQTASSISIDSTSDLILDINGLASGWVFRWADPNIADLQALINAGEVTFSYSNGGSYTITSDGTYTYVNVIPVPEPSALLLSGVAAGLLVGSRRGRRTNPASTR